MSRRGGLYRALATRRFPGSSQYWEQRYRSGNSSGPGSYGGAARYKAQFLNAFVSASNIESVIEFGCGDGNQLSLALYPKYTGLDVSTTAISACAERFSEDNTKSFFLYSPEHFIDRQGVLSADIAISLDVILHLVEDDIFEKYMRDLFNAAERYVVIYSSDETMPDPAKHVRHRAFSPWIRANETSWTLATAEPNPYWDTTLASFFVYERAPLA